MRQAPDSLSLERHERNGKRRKPADDLELLVKNVDLSSASDDSGRKARIKDIVFEPFKRKRLLDSLNIVTTREKLRQLQEDKF